MKSYTNSATGALLAALPGATLADAIDRYYHTETLQAASHQHEQAMLAQSLAFAERIQPSHTWLLALIAVLLVLTLVLLTWLALRQRHTSNTPAHQPVQIHLHVSQPTTEYLPPADNRHMAALATRLQQEKRLALGGGK